MPPPSVSPKGATTTGFGRELDGLRHALELADGQVDLVPLFFLDGHQQQHDVGADGKVVSVVGDDADNFSVGANVMLLLMSVQEEEWDEVDLAIRQFQGMTQAIKFSPKPVVVAPFGLCLGGGTEITLHAAARQPHAELYAGLVEVGVGLLPGGGGCKEMLLRAVDSAAAIRPGRGESIELMEAMKKAFETIATGKVATSAHEARGLGFLHESDNITMNRERVLADAKARALELVRAGYEPPQPRTDIPAPGENVLAALRLGVQSCGRANTSPTTK